MTSPISNSKEKAHKHKRFYPVTARGGGGRGVLRPGGQGSNVYVLCAEPKEHKHFCPGTRPGGLIGDRGDREIVYVPHLYAPFLAPSNQVPNKHINIKK